LTRQKPNKEDKRRNQPNVMSKNDSHSLDVTWRNALSDGGYSGEADAVVKTERSDVPWIPDAFSFGIPNPSSPARE
jgi:hypothetical protein